MMSLMFSVVQGYLISGSRVQVRKRMVLCRLEMYIKEQERYGRED
jgi:hypothetical protein